MECAASFPGVHYRATVCTRGGTQEPGGGRQGGALRRRQGAALPRAAQPPGACTARTPHTAIPVSAKLPAWSAVLRCCGASPCAALNILDHAVDSHTHTQSLCCAGSVRGWDQGRCHSLDHMRSVFNSLAGEGDRAHGDAGIWAEGVRLRPAALRARPLLRVRRQRLVLRQELAQGEEVLLCLSQASLAQSSQERDSSSLRRTPNCPSCIQAMQP
jgi:hypothetical protein